MKSLKTIIINNKMAPEIKERINGTLNNELITTESKDITKVSIPPDPNLVLGFINYDEVIWGYDWDWRILQIFERPNTGFVGLSKICLENMHMEGYWHSPKNHKPPVGMAPLLFPVTPCDTCGPAPFFVRADLLNRMKSRIKPHISTYTSVEISRSVKAMGQVVYATAIPFEKINCYIAHEDIK